MADSAGCHEGDRDSRTGNFHGAFAEKPLAAAGVDEEFAQQVSEFITQYRPALEELAK